MQKFILVISLTFLFFNSTQLNAQYSKEDNSHPKYFVGSTMFVLGNFAKSNKPDFAQLNLGYRLTGKDVVSLELKTWKYAWSLGIPYGDTFEAPEEEFPGFISYLWKGLYAGVHVMNAFQTYKDTEGNKFDKGFQLFNTYRLGYHIKLFNDKFFIQPSIAVTHRPFQTEMPEGFKELNDKWSKFFIGEPGLHFGFNF